MKKFLLASILALALAAPALASTPDGSLLDGVKPGPDGMIDVLTVFAHQDDESVYGGGTLFLLKRDPRVRLHILCMTIGDMSEAKDKLNVTPEHLGKIRIEELKTAAAVYEADEVIFLGYHDQGLESADREELISKVADAMDKTGAEIVITHDPSGLTGHPDHMTTSAVATEAFKRSGAQRLYYVTFAPWMYRLFKTVAPYAAGGKPAKPTLKVNIRGVKKLKRMALYAHASQKHFSNVGIAMEFELMFNNEYFALAESRD